MKQLFIVAIVLMLAAGCTAAQSQTPAPAADTPSTAATSQAFMPVVGNAGSPPTQLTPQVFLPLVGQSGQTCETHTAAMTTQANPPTLKTGDLVTITVTLANQGCAPMGQPQYQLDIQSNTGQPLFDPATPTPIVHNLGIGTAQADTVEFILRAIAPGQATIIASASFEVHLGYPGPAYWGNAGAAPLLLDIAP